MELLLRQFATDKSFIIACSDKGIGVVILDKSGYFGSMMHLVSDPPKIISISESLKKITFLYEYSINRLLSELKASGVISDKMFHNLYASESSPDILYGLP